MVLTFFFGKKWCTEFFYKKVLITFSQSKKTFVNFLAPVYKIKMWWYFFFFFDIPSILILFFSFIWGWICFVCMYFYQGCDRLTLIEQQLNKENYPQFFFKFQFQFLIMKQLIFCECSIRMKTGTCYIKVLLNRV